MALSLSRKARLFRLKALVAVQDLQRFKHTVAKTGNDDLKLKQVKLDSVIEKNDTSRGYKLDLREIKITQANISPSSYSVLQTLQKAGFKAYLVGGCVRDLILKKVPKDFDVITTAELKQVKKLFHRAPIIGNNFPICQVHIKSSVVEVSNFQTGKAKRKKLNFLQMPQGLNKKDALLWSDAMRRDFTVNSLFFDPFAQKIYDYAGGVKDLKSLELRTLIPPHISFKEDCARILRGLRIAARIGLSISKETETAIHELSFSISSLTKSRLMMEMNYMLSYGAAEASLGLLCRFHLLKTLLPLHAARLTRQINGGSDMNSLFLMRLFSNLDKLVTCDRPTDSILWVAILAFHLSLLNKPQAPLVIWTFGSLLYNDNQPEAVEFARKKAEVPIISVAEISESCDLMSDDALVKRVAQLATSAQNSAHAFTGTNSSGLAYIPNNTGKCAAELFVLAVKAKTLERTSQSVHIDYRLLGKGNKSVTRRALGKIILDTMSSFLGQSDSINNIQCAKKINHQPIKSENSNGSKVGVALHNGKNKQAHDTQSAEKKNHQPPIKLENSSGSSKVGLVLHNGKNKQAHDTQSAEKKNHRPIKLENSSGSKVGVALHNGKNKQAHDPQSAEKKIHQPIKLENSSGSKVGVALHNEKNKPAHYTESPEKKNHQPIKLENSSGSKVGVAFHNEKNKQDHGIQSADKKNHQPIKLVNGSGSKNLGGIQSLKKNPQPIHLKNMSESKVGVVLDNEKNKQAHGIQNADKKNQQPIKSENGNGSKIGVVLHTVKIKQVDGIQSVKKNQPPIQLKNASAPKVGVILDNEKNKQAHGIQSAKKKNQHPIKLENAIGSNVGLPHNEENKQGHGRENVKNNQNPIKSQHVGESKVGRIEVHPNEKIEKVRGIQATLEQRSGSKVGKTDPIIHCKKEMDQEKPKETKQKGKVESIQRLSRFFR